MSAGDHGWRPFEPSLEACVEALVWRWIDRGLLGGVVIPADVEVEADPEDPTRVIVTYTERRIEQVAWSHRVDL